MSAGKLSRTSGLVLVRATVVGGTDTLEHGAGSEAGGMAIHGSTTTDTISLFGVDWS